MKHSEVLGRYVNTGERLPKEQYDRLTPSLKKSYFRIRSVAGLEYWEFKIINDHEKIKYIEKKGEKLTNEDIIYLLDYSENKDDIATKIIEVKGEKLNNYEVENLMTKKYFNIDVIYIKIIEKKGIQLNNRHIKELIKYSKNKDLIATKIIDVKGEKLNDMELFSTIYYSDNVNDSVTIKIIDVKGEKLNNDDIRTLLKYSENKELIKKTLLQNGVDYKLINDAIIKFNNIDTSLIPDNYQSMIQEIRRIKEIMI